MVLTTEKGSCDWELFRFLFVKHKELNVMSLMSLWLWVDK